MSNKKMNAELEKFLYINTKRGNWDAVVAEYEKAYEVAQTLKLTQEGDTALHLAVIDNQEEIVEKLVKLICRSIDYKILLEAKNERKNNPLHLAAAVGSARMCHAIASAHEGLVDKRNKDGETPIFLATVHGHRNVFYCLYYFCRSDLKQANFNCRRNNGDTVLHCALRNEHFDLAFQIINVNKEAVNWVDEEGFTPLHVLASQPTVFKSGTHTKGWRKIVYYCTFVDQLKPQSIETLSKVWKKSMPTKNSAPCSFPDNYNTCIEFFMILWDGFSKATNLKRLLNKKDNDLEKYVNKESENLDADEPQERLHTEFHKADSQSAMEPSITNFPENYSTCIDFFHNVFLAIMIILGFGVLKIRKIREKKQKHTWSVQVMKKLLKFAPSDKYGNDGKTPMGSKIQTGKADGTTLPYHITEDEVQFSKDIDSEPEDSKKPIDGQESAILLAAKYGVIEMVMALFEHFPMAIHDTTKDKKNIVLLAAEYRQPDVYRFLLKKKYQTESLFRAVDEKGNSALHLAAAAIAPKLWRITGAALQMQWEFKWYKFVKESVPLQSFARYNKEGKTASKIFHESHSDLVENGENWLTKTSKACSVVAALIVTLAFATATSIPGGTDSNGAAVLEKEQGFFIFVISSVIALCLSSTSVIMFLAILISRFDAKDFGSNLPWKLLIGLSSLYFSIIAMLISFCAGHYFLIVDRLQNIAILLYTVTFLPVALIFGILQLPLFFDLLQATLKIVPSRRADVILSTIPPATENLSNVFKTGKFEVVSMRVEKDIPSKPLLIFTPTAQGSYPLIFFLPDFRCNESSYSGLLQLMASHGFVIVAPRQYEMTTLSETKETESSSQVMRWQKVEAALSELSVSGHSKEENKAFSLALGYGSPSSHPFSAMISFDDPMAETKFQDPHSLNIYAPTLESQFVISKLCGNVN